MRVLIAVVVIAGLALQCAGQLPDNPKPQKVFDAKFYTMAVTDFSLSFGDSMASTKIISSSTNPGCYETDTFFYGKGRPSPARYFGESMAITTGANVLGAILKKHKSRFWAVPAAIDSIAHFMGMTQTIDDIPCRRY